MGRKGLFFFVWFWFGGFFLLFLFVVGLVWFFVVPLLKFLWRLLMVSNYCICSVRMVTWESVQLGTNTCNILKY